MKELLTHLKEDIRHQIVASIPKKTEYVLMGVIKPKGGHRVFEFNLDTHACTEATYKNRNVSFHSPSLIKELVIRNGHLYIPALNMSNAIKHYNLDRVQSSYYVKEPPFKFF